MNLNLQDLLAIWSPILMLTGFMWYHFNSRFDKIDEKLEKMDEKISSVEEKLGADIKRVEEKVDAVRGLVDVWVTPYAPS